MRKPRAGGFLLISVLLVCLLLTAAGMVLVERSAQDRRYVEHESLWLQACETAQSGVVYYRVHGVPPLVNGQPAKLYPFGDKIRSVEIAVDGDVVKVTGTMWGGTAPRSQVTVQCMTWDTEHVEVLP